MNEKNVEKLTSFGRLPVPGGFGDSLVSKVCCSAFSSASVIKLISHMGVVLLGLWAMPLETLWYQQIENGLLLLLVTSLFTSLELPLVIIFSIKGKVKQLHNPFASIGCTGTSKGKVKVRDICLNISFLTWFFSFFTHIWKKVQSLLSKKKRSLDISLQHKNGASYKFSKKKNYPLVPYPHTYIALYHLHAKVTCNTHTHTQKQEIVNHPSLGSSLVS